MRCKFYKLITHFINKKAVQPAAQKVEASLVVAAAKKIKFTAAARNQILKASMLKFKAKHPSKSKNQSVKFKPSRPSRKQSCD